MLIHAMHGQRVADALPLSRAQREMTLAEYEARRCRECGVSHAPDDPNAPTLYATPAGPICDLEIAARPGEETDS